MSREHLYKAKRVSWRELPKEEWWVEGNLIWSNKADKEYTAIIVPKEDSGMFSESDNDDLGFEIWYLVDPETVCEYTGVSDKNGKKIFENDTVAFMDTYSTYNGYAEAYCIGHVFWSEEELRFGVTSRLSAESWGGYCKNALWYGTY